MNVAECIITRKSIRRYKDKPVGHSVIDSIVSMASYSPSWKNTQLTRYTAVEDSSHLNKTADKFTPEYNSRLIGYLHVLIVVILKKAAAVMNVTDLFRPKKKITDYWQMSDIDVSCQNFFLLSGKRTWSCDFVPDPGYAVKNLPE